jgi:hypothetical protein
MATGDDASAQAVVLSERIERTILLIRGQKVILDTDLAALYGVTPKRLNEQVKRNRERFPADFTFQLTEAESLSLRSQIATLKQGRGRHRTYLRRAFTEHGAIMAASVLRSPRAVEMSILVVRAFVRLRSLLASHRDLAAKLDELERKLSTHDQQIVAVVAAIRELMAPLPASAKKIGFRTQEPATSPARGRPPCAHGTFRVAARL